MKKTGLEQLTRSLKAGPYEEQYRHVMELVEAGSIRPVKASGLNGKKPALYREYWLVEEERDFHELEAELKYQIVPDISVDYYLSHLKVYERDRPWVLMMNSYLRNHRDYLDTMESMNERSFEIWGREKFLKQEEGKKILKRMGILPERLNLYETTEPLSYYSHNRDVPQKLLIIENKDTFYTMRRHLLSGNRTILGMEIGTLIYGAGKGILRSFRDFSLCAEPYMNEQANEIYYFGDLDYEGIGIYENLFRLFADFCQIRPFTQAYLSMVKKAEESVRLPDSKEGQNRRCGDLFWNYFKEDDRVRMERILVNGTYIPQEILSIRDL